MILTLDTETGPILPRPYYPPALHGVAIKVDDGKAEYHLANNSHGSTVDLETKLRDLIERADKVVFHNGKFDSDVLEAAYGIKIPEHKYEDTLFLAYLDNPNAESLGLKDLAAKLLNEPPDERDEIVDWLVNMQPVQGRTLSASKLAKENYAGAWVSYAPPELVGKYACGDVDRTYALYTKLLLSVDSSGMGKAYQVEKELMNILRVNEAQGILVNTFELDKDIHKYKAILAALEIWIKKYIGVSDEFNLNSGHKFVEALINKNLVDVNKLELSPKSGKYRSNKETMAKAITDPTLLAAKNYIASVQTCLNTFMEPWLGQALETGGTIHTNWNQTRQGDSDTRKGTRTGRLSSTPNFQNIPKEFVEFFNVAGKPAWPIDYIDYAPLPRCRNYIIAGKGMTFINRDFSQQEIRVFAHFEDGELQQKYNEDPWMDMHDFAKDVIKQVLGLEFKRKLVKTLNLGIMYGMGVDLLIQRMQPHTDIPLTADMVKKIKQTILDHLPGWAAMNAIMRQRAKSNSPIKTWLGRIHYCEEPEIVNGRLRTFDYKMVNTLVQSSAADCTKVAIIRAVKALKEVEPRANFSLQVHDEIMFSVPEESKIKCMEVLRETMESLEFSVPMLSEGKIGPVWGLMMPYDERGKVIYKETNNV